MPSSSRFGSRPRSSWMRAYSDSLSPCCAMTSLLRAMSVEERGQHPAAVGIAEQRLGVPLGVGHHPQHVPRGVHDAGDVGPASVGILEVAEHHLPLTLQALQTLVVDKVVPVAVGDGDLERLPELELGGEAGPRLLGAEHHVLADVLAIRVLEQRPREKPCLGEDLKAVADADDRPALPGERGHLLHHRREARDGPATQVVAVAEATGEDDQLAALQVVVLVPQHLRLVAEDLPRGVKGILVAVAAGEDDDPDLHPISTRKFSTTVLARSFRHISSTCARASGPVPSGSCSSMYLPRRTPETWPKPSACRLPSTAFPAGSSTPGFSVTYTRASMSPPVRHPAGCPRGGAASISRARRRPPES